MSKVKVTAFSVSLDGYGPDRIKVEITRWVREARIRRTLLRRTQWRSGRFATAGIHGNTNPVRQACNARDPQEKQVSLITKHKVANRP